MTNYKEGVWYPWNGGKCPVPGDAKVEIMYDSGGIESGEMSADKYNWSGDGSIVAFSVIEYPVDYMEIPTPDNYFQYFDKVTDRLSGRSVGMFIIQLAYHSERDAKKVLKAIKGETDE